VMLTLTMICQSDRMSCFIRTESEIVSFAEEYGQSAKTINLQ